MSGEFEAAGAMATAGLAAGAIEGREAHGAGEGACLNCGAKLEGAYCGQCGQAAHPHRTLVHVFEEFLHGVIHFDTKAWRTLPMLFFRPGTLTRNYVYGKRARYISPLALFLFTIFFMFAVFAFSGGAGDGPVTVTETTSVEEAQADIAEARAELAEAEAELERVLANPDPDRPAGLDEGLARQAVGLAQGALARRQAALERAEARAAGPPVEREQGAVDIGVDSADTEEGPLTWQDAAREAAESEDFVVIHGWDSLNYKVREKMRNPDLAVYKVQQAAYKFSFLLIPISLPFIALLFLWKKGVTFYDHVVFALYSLSFASLAFVLMATVGGQSWLRWIVPTILLVGLPVHMFFHLGGAYALGWFSALWRTFFLMFFSIISLTIFFIVIIILGLAG